MNIAGLQKMTLLDYPGKIACTVFLPGCNLRCPFCHNPSLVLPERLPPLIPQEELLQFLRKRANLLEGVCITGGEPTLHADLPQLLEHQEAHRAAEIASRQCLSGPHKDDRLVDIDGNPVKNFASQGQTRTAALSLKLAAREIFQQDTGEYPVLLLDDVLSELDPRRQAFVLNRIQGGQIFITCCEEDKLEGLEGGKTFHIRGGALL